MKSLALAVLLVAFPQLRWAGEGEGITLPTATVRAKGPADMTAAVILPAGSLPCTRVDDQKEGWLTCPPAVGAQLEFSRPGYEVRRLDPGPPPWPTVWDLDDDGWRPTPIRLTLDPPELAAAALVVWLEGEEIVTATADEQGSVSGPRLHPGQRFGLVVVGETVEGAILEGQRTAAEEPVRVALREGRGWVALCRDPWSAVPLAQCTVTAGARPRLMRDRGLARLDGRGRGRPVGLLHVFDARRTEIVQAQAPGFPPLVLADPTGPVLELTLPQPRSLRVLLRESGAGRPVMGRVYLAHRHERITVAEAVSDHRGSIELSVGDGDYELFGEAEGFGGVRQVVTVDKPRVEVRLALRPTAAARGWVVSEDGEPLPGAVVIGSPRQQAEAGNRSHAAAGLLGEFTLPLAGEGPWVVTATFDGFGQVAVTIDHTAAPLTLRLPRRCEVKLQLLAAQGTPLEADTVAAINLSTMEVVQARRQRDGSFSAHLAPGTWLVVDEAQKASAVVSTPAFCAGWSTVVYPTRGHAHEPSTRPAAFSPSSSSEGTSPGFPPSTRCRGGPCGAAVMLP